MTSSLGTIDNDIWHSKLAIRPHQHILMDSATSGTVVGFLWLIQWGATHSLLLGESDPHFRFGDGVGRRIIGVCVTY